MMTIRPLLTFSYSVALILAAGCCCRSTARALELTQNLQRCATEEEAELVQDFFPDKFVPQDPDGLDLLKIEYFGTYKIVHNNFQNKSYLMYQCGTDPPADEVSSGKYHLVLPVPHKGGVAVTETPQIPPIELLGKRRDVFAYFGNPIYISSPCLEFMMDVEGSVKGYYDEDDPFNVTLQAMRRSEFMADNPDAVIFGGPYGDKDGDRVLSVAASQERTNVATFDWIGLYGALFNLEEFSNSISGATKGRYDCSAGNAAVLSADRTQSQRPTVLWAQYIEGYNWSVAECPTWDATYYCEYATHCGARMLARPEGVGWNNPDYGGNFWYLNDDEVLALGKDADVWIYPSKTFTTVYEQKKELFDQFKALQNQQV